MVSSDQQRVKIFGVPVDLGSCPLGVEMGPNAVRYAGLGKALTFNHIEYEDYGDLTIRGTKRFEASVGTIAAMSEELAELVGHALGDNCVPVILGGDHSASIGSIAGASSVCGRLGLLWLDCHPDANMPETSPTGNIHGMTVAISLGYGYPELVNCGGFKPKVAPEDVCIVGAKDIDRGEKEFLERVGVRMFTMRDIQRRGMVEVMEEAVSVLTEETERLHVSFDIDVLDPVVAPGTGITSRGGLSYREISLVMEELGARKLVSSIDIIEINPLADVRNQTAELAVELLITALGGAYTDYERYYLDTQELKTK